MAALALSWSLVWLSKLALHVVGAWIDFSMLQQAGVEEVMPLTICLQPTREKRLRHRVVATCYPTVNRPTEQGTQTKVIKQFELKVTKTT